MKIRQCFRIAGVILGVGLIVCSLANILSITASLRSGMKAAASAISPVSAEANRARWDEINPDIVGWLSVDGTGIDFPVLQDRALRADYLENGRYTFTAPDDLQERQKLLYKYLFYDYRGRPSDVGSIMVDAVYDLRDAYVVIYGHNAHSPGVLFSDLKSFEQPDFFDGHRTARLYTQDGSEELRLLMVSRISCYAQEVYGTADLLRNGFDTDAMLACLSQNKLFGEAEAKERYVLLSTCSEEAEDEDRLVLLYGVSENAV